MCEYPITTICTENVPSGKMWRQVPNAIVGDIREGDLVMILTDDGEIFEHAVIRIIPETGLPGQCTLRFTDSLFRDIKISRICPVIVMRQTAPNLQT